MTPYTSSFGLGTDAPELHARCICALNVTNFNNPLF